MTSAKGRVRRSAAQWSEIFAAFDASGVGTAEFARLVGVKYPTLGAGFVGAAGQLGVR